jgi:hypothetical protein
LAGTRIDRMAKFILMEYLPRTLETYIRAYHQHRARVPYKQTVAILAGVRAMVLVCDVWVPTTRKEPCRVLAHPR